MIHQHFEVFTASVLDRRLTGDEIATAIREKIAAGDGCDGSPVVAVVKELFDVHRDLPDPSFVRDPAASPIYSDFMKKSTN